MHKTKRRSWFVLSHKNLRERVCISMFQGVCPCMTMHVCVCVCGCFRMGEGGYILVMLTEFYKLWLTLLPTAD